MFGSKRKKKNAYSKREQKVLRKMYDEMLSDNPENACRAALREYMLYHYDKSNPIK